MATVTRKTSGAANIVFGVSGITVTGTIVQGFDSAFGSQKNETPDSTGATVAAAWYDNKKALTVEALFNSASALTIAPGDAITVNGLASFLDTYTTKQASTEFEKVTLNLTYYVDNTLT